VRERAPILEAFSDQNDEVKTLRERERERERERYREANDVFQTLELHEGIAP
jgi:hypothetical protein